MCLFLGLGASASRSWALGGLGAEDPMDAQTGICLSSGALGVKGLVFRV